MTKEQKEINTKKAVFHVNMAFLLVDIINTHMLDACEALAKMEQDVKYSDKLNLKRALGSVRVAEKRTKEFSKHMYDIESVNQMCEDSDYINELLKLIVLKSGDADEEREEILNIFRRMPDKVDDFPYKTLKVL